MKVELNQNFKSGGVFSSKKANVKQQSFTGISQAEKEVMDLIHHKKAILWMKKMEWLKGEIGGILLTAIGTGTIAPIFIGLNPFVKPKKDATPQEKEDLKNTKLYTAMRQPISALLAILFQASVQKYIDMGLDALFNIPNRAKEFRLNLDQQDLNTENYIKSQVRKTLKEEGHTKPSILKSLFTPKIVVDGEKLSLRERYDLVVIKMVEEIKNNQLNKIANNFERTNQIRIGERTLDNETLAKLVNKQIEEYKSDITKMIKTDEQVAFYVNRADTLIKNEKKLNKMFKDVPLTQIKAETDPQKLADLYKQTTEIVENLLEREEDSEIRKILQEILDKPDDLRANKIDRTLQRIESIKGMCEGRFTKQRYLDALSDRNGVLRDRKVKLEAIKIKTPAEADATVIGQAIEKIKQYCHFNRGDGIIESVLKDTDTFSDDAAKLKSKIYKDIAKGYRDLVKHNYKSLNQITKILIGVGITLPITCTALNWLYPRIMELLFPKLAGVKKDKTSEQPSQKVNEQKVGGDK